MSHNLRQLLKMSLKTCQSGVGFHPKALLLYPEAPYNTDHINITVLLISSLSFTFNILWNLVKFYPSTKFNFSTVL